jgi:hypothetical protein
MKPCRVARGLMYQEDAAGNRHWRWRRTPCRARMWSTRPSRRVGRILHRQAALTFPQLARQLHPQSRNPHTFRIRGYKNRLRGLGAKSFHCVGDGATRRACSRYGRAMIAHQRLLDLATHVASPQSLASDGSAATNAWRPRRRRPAARRQCARVSSERRLVLGPMSPIESATTSMLPEMRLSAPVTP